MALKKVTELDNGVTAEYFRIDSMSLKEGSAIVMVGLYLNSTAAHAGKSALKTWTVDMRSASFTKAAFSENPYALLYSKLKVELSEAPSGQYRQVMPAFPFGSFEDV